MESELTDNRTEDKPLLDSEALRDLVVDALDDIKGQEIISLDVRDQTDIADFMVVASGGTPRQVKALVDSVTQKAKEAGQQILGTEGLEDSEWVLVDAGDVIVHVMLPKVREFYELERLWSVSPGNPSGSSRESEGSGESEGSAQD